jgi:hypothetical protein
MNEDFDKIPEKVKMDMIGALIFGIVLVIAMLVLLIWVLNKAYSRRDE